MNSAKQIPVIAKLCHRSLSQVTEVPTPRFKQLKEIQKNFQIDDGTPVYLKAGVSDKILYLGTVLLTVVGMGMSAETLFHITFPKKN